MHRVQALRSVAIALALARRRLGGVRKECGRHSRPPAKSCSGAARHFRVPRRAGRMTCERRHQAEIRSIPPLGQRWQSCEGKRHVGLGKGKIEIEFRARPFPTTMLFQLGGCWWVRGSNDQANATPHCALKNSPGRPAITAWQAGLEWTTTSTSYFRLFARC